MTRDNQHQDGIDIAAADWALRAEDGALSPAERTALDRWLAADPAHERAFAEARRAWRYAGDALGTQAPRSPAPDSAVRFSTVRGRRRRLRPVHAIAASILLLLAASALVTDPYVAVMADARTAPGDTQVVPLSDGSRVVLGPDSAIRVNFTDSTRTVTLLEGVAYFQAASVGTDGETRPFVVHAAEVRIQALGTAFTVDRMANRVEVTAVTHRIQVSLPGQSPEERLLVPGQAVTYGASGLGALHDRPADEATAWRDGRLIFDHVPLTQVIETLGRYRTGTVVLARPDLKEHRVSGVFNTDDPDKVLNTIAERFSLSRISVTPLLTVLY